MTFLNPLLLAGLFLAVIPLVIHLFNFRKPRRVDFSSLEFVRELRRTTMQRVRIKQWLLLLLRTLALACVALVFARPTLDSRIASAVGGDARTSVGVLIDNSPSMTIRSSSGGYLDQAKALAGKVAEKMEASDTFVLHSLSSINPTAYRSAAAAERAISGVAIDARRIDISAGIREMLRTLQGLDTVNTELYIVTDGQESTLGDSLASGGDGDVNIYVLQIGDTAPDNIAIIDFQLISRIVESGQPVETGVRVANFGTRDVQDYVVSAYLGGDRVAQATVDIPAGGTATANLTITPKERGWLEGEVRLEDDAFEPDNVYFFALQVPESRRILLVRGEDRRTSYLPAALAAGRAEDRSLFQIENVSEAKLAASNVDDYHVTILDGVRDLTSGEINVLSRYVQNGGGVVIFPAREASIADYNALLGELGGGTFEGFFGAENLDEPVTRLESLELDHPLFTGVFELGSNREIEKPEIFFAVDYRPVRGSEQTLMRLGNGKPLLQELPHGGGSSLLFTVLPDPAWSDLPVRGLFVPLLYRSIYYLSSSSSTLGADLLAGRDGEVVLPGSFGEDGLRLVNRFGAEFVPVITSVTGGSLITVPAEMNRSGITRVLSDSTVVALLPVNPDPLESDLASLEGEDLADRLSGLIRLEVRNIQVGGVSSRELEDVVTAARTGVELWRPLLLAGLLFLIVEMLVSRLWVPESAATGN